jgi:hypothetical protein
MQRRCPGRPGDPGPDDSSPGPDEGEVGRQHPGAPGPVGRPLGRPEPPGSDLLSRTSTFDNFQLCPERLFRAEFFCCADVFGLMPAIHGADRRSPRTEAGRP